MIDPFYKNIYPNLKDEGWEDIENKTYGSVWFEKIIKTTTSYIVKIRAVGMPNSIKYYLEVRSNLNVEFKDLIYGELREYLNLDELVSINLDSLIEKVKRKDEEYKARLIKIIEEGRIDG